MKHLKTYKIFESNSNIEKELQKYPGGIKNYTIDSDGFLSVDSDVLLSNGHLTKLPFKFKEVTGNFDCGNNQLTSLDGCPFMVSYGFYCNNNKLDSLKHCPKSIGGYFNCSDNQLTTLMWLPDVPKNLHCKNNKLANLDTSSWIGGNIYCEGNLFTEDPEFFGECDGKIIWKKPESF